MDSTEFVRKMLTLSELKQQVASLEAELEQAVLDFGKTQVIGNLKAQYRKGRPDRDYETPGQTAPPEIIKKHTTVRESVSWKAVCADAGIEPVIRGELPPSVKFILLEDE